ncbi:MAG: hypothetical protein GEV00_03670 [Actinophytocola sp.]|nr:hypothetical protein [Actinophytocola sp.]
MGCWRRHQKKDLEAVLEHFHRAGWRIEAGKRYYKVKCPCGRHRRYIHLTPSDPHYGRNALSWLRRQQCYDSEGDTER